MIKSWFCRSKTKKSCKLNANLQKSVPIKTKTCRHFPKVCQNVFECDKSFARAPTRLGCQRGAYFCDETSTILIFFNCAKIPTSSSSARWVYVLPSFIIDRSFLISFGLPDRFPNASHEKKDEARESCFVPPACSAGISGQLAGRKRYPGEATGQIVRLVFLIGGG